MLLKAINVTYLVGFLCLASFSLAQEEALGPNGQPRPEPYSFSYSADSIGASSSRQETGDASGKIIGFYTITGPDGRERRVDYVADDGGYRATIKTNEIGTVPQETGDARFQVSPPSEAQLAAVKDANNANNANRLNIAANQLGPNTFRSPSNQVKATTTKTQAPKNNKRDSEEQELSSSGAGASAANPSPAPEREPVPSASQNLAQRVSQTPDESQSQPQQTLVNLDTSLAPKSAPPL